MRKRSGKIPVGAARLALLASMAMFLCGGCATRVIAPPPSKQPVAVFVADYGHHSSLLLPTHDGALVEYAFGDWNYFAEGHYGWYDGFNALFFSRKSTLGRRRLDADLHSADAGEEILQRVPALRLQEFTASRDRVDRLMHQLDDEFRSHLRTMIYNSECDLSFVTDDEHYGIANNCNHLTARWLSELGCRVEGPVLLSNFQIVQANGTPEPAYARTPTGDIEPATQPSAQAVVAEKTKSNRAMAAKIGREENSH